MFELQFKTDNAAFDCKRIEVKRILEEVALKVEWGIYDGVIQDNNGNTIGYYNLEEGEES